MTGPARETPLTQREIGRHGAPAWAAEVVALCCGRHDPAQWPSVDFVPVVQADTYGGRYFPRLSAILVYETDDEHLNRGTLVHELAHWRSYMERCGQPAGRSRCGYHGDHDGYFYRILAPLYRRAGIAPAVRREVEGSYSFPDHLLR